jgi:hypothetical protein
MNLTSKIALALVASTTAAIVTPLVASANPVTGSTAAAVSIKFGKNGSGNFSIQPGSNANGGGSNVQELSAAVATGETTANAKAQSTRMGTSADASGYSAPVYFSYETYNNSTKAQSSVDVASQSEFKAQAAIEFAANSKSSSSGLASVNNKFSETVKGRKLVNVNSESNAFAEAKAANEASTKLNASAQASASQTASRKESGSLDTKSVGTSYEYSGSSAGLQFLPPLVK